MTGLAEAATELAELLERENEALRRLDVRATATLIGEKRISLAALELAERHPSRPPADDPDMRRAAARLLEAAACNKSLLERAIAAQKHLMSLLAQAARQAAPETRYGARGSHLGGATCNAFALSARA